MSGIIGNNLGKSKVIEGLIQNKGTLEACAKITSDSPGSGDFSTSLNVGSVSYSSTTITLNFLNTINRPITLFNSYGFSTGGFWKFVLSDVSATVGATSTAPAYREMANTGMTATTNTNLNGALIMVYGMGE